MSDAEFVELALEGQDEAFDKLVAKYRASMLSFCFHLVADREEARDLAQETFVQAYESLSSLKEGEKFGSWLYGVAANICKRWLRRRRREQVFVTGNPTESDFRSQENAVNLPEMVERNDLAGRILSCIRRLPPDYRIVAALRFESDLKYSEIADLLGLPLSLIKVRLHRAKRMLRERLAGVVFEGGEKNE